MPGTVIHREAPAGAVDKLRYVPLTSSKGSDAGLISRYTRPAMGAVWSDERKFQRWLDVEIAAMAAWAELDVVPHAAVTLSATALVSMSPRIREIEDRTHHDVLAFTESVAEQVGDPEHSRWFHYGLTSSDVGDTALALQLRDAGELIVAAITEVERVALRRAEEYRHTPMIGRTHGVHAEPTTFGLKLLGWVTELRRQRERLRAAFDGVAVGKLSGAVGAYANTDPRVEEIALRGARPAPRGRRHPGDSARPPRRAALRRSPAPAPASSGTPSRCATCSAPRCARRASRSPRARRAPRRCPTSATRSCASGICGLARVLRGNAIVGLEDIALWHERDISHSSAERVVLPDSTIALDYMLDKTPAG